MKLLSKFFGLKSTVTPETHEGRGTREADAAIREALAGRIAVPEMLRAILAAQIYVPLSAPPVFRGNYMQSWHPSTVTKRDGGQQFLVVFTDDALVGAYHKANPEYSYLFAIDAFSVLTLLPPKHGIVFNIGDETSFFEWSAEEISAYREEMEW
ncbi:MAG TPA: SseB family protein [Pyrinomonadaceae bacterium]|nr:SseB family protein [Pyrinomonadaceae bacterium]